MEMLAGHDIELIRQSRSRDRYKDFSDNERAAYRRVHAALGELGQIAVDELGGPRDYVRKLTSSFHPDSGVSGGKPKALWLGTYPQRNVDPVPRYAACLRMISRGGSGYGVSAVTPPEELIDPRVKPGVQNFPM